jgi:hypothetical protein
VLSGAVYIAGGVLVLEIQHGWYSSMPLPRCLCKMTPKEIASRGGNR